MKKCSSNGEFAILRKGAGMRMKLQYLGTAAAEGIPAFFCDCEVCRRARENGGRNLRTRSQALVNGRLLLDFPCDTLAHAQRNGLELSNIHHCLITHGHDDHFYPEDMNYLQEGFAHLPEEWGSFTVYGSGDIEREMEKTIERTGARLAYRRVEPFVTLEAGGFAITPLKARHGTPHPYIYIIDDGVRAMLYAHDTGDFPDETWEYLSRCGVKLGLVSLDCTGGANEHLGYDSHMCLGDNRRCREKLRMLKLCGDETLFVCNHFSHNGLHSDYDSFSYIAAKEDFLTSYDGMKLEF